MKPKFFGKPVAFHKWLEEHHASATELLVGFYKKGSGRPSMYLAGISGRGTVFRVD